jgi:hypothetical protein
MHLNDAGHMVQSHWLEIPSHHESIDLDAFVVMPNHLHGIVFLREAEPISPVSLSGVIGAFKSRVAVDYSAGVRAGHYPVMIDHFGSGHSVTASSSLTGVWRRSASTSRAIRGVGRISSMHDPEGPEAGDWTVRL